MMFGQLYMPVESVLEQVPVYEPPSQWMIDADKRERERRESLTQEQRDTEDSLSLRKKELQAYQERTDAIKNQRCTCASTSSPNYNTQDSGFLGGVIIGSIL